MKSAAKLLTLTGMAFIGSALLLQSCKKTDVQNTDTQTGSTLSATKSKQTETLDLQLVTNGFRSPLGVVPFPDNSKRLAVIDQPGQIWIIDANGNKLPTPFIDVSSKIVQLNAPYDERGLLGLAFHPDYASNGNFYLYYTAPPNPGGPTPGTAWNNLSTISEFRVSGNPNVAGPGTERFLFRLDDPQSNHNGGTIAFGPDGYLYIAIGDGGRANDVGPGHVEDWYATNPGGNAQNIEANLFGKFLRVDVNTTTAGLPYGIPWDNPFVGREGRDEIFAYGFRNPYRFSFDMGGARDLIAGDAGQLMFEEVDVVKKGRNYGWNVREGYHCFNALAATQPLLSCPTKDPWNNQLEDPVLELNNVNNPGGGIATTVIGGNVYRGSAIKSLNDMYIFGTYSRSIGVANAELYIAKSAGMSNWKYTELVLQSFPDHLGQYLKGFGQDLAGEIYVTTSDRGGPSIPGDNTGKVFKLVAAN